MCHPARKSGGKGIAVLKRKFFNNNNLHARGGLEPLFRVLFSAIFQGFPWEFPSGWKTAESSGKKTVVNCSQSTYKVYICFDRKLPLREDLKNPSNKAV